MKIILNKNKMTILGNYHQKKLVEMNLVPATQEKNISIVMDLYNKIIMNDIKIGSNRSFGLVFFVVFFIISIYPILNNGDIRIWSLILSFVFLILGLLNSKILSPLNKIWFKFGIFLGKFISPIIMGLIFFVVVTPIGLLMRVLRKDLLNLKFSNHKSYWIEKKGPESKMRNQF